MGGKAVALACDVTREEAVRAAAAEAERQLGEIDIVVNNVGAINSALPEETPVSEWRRMFDLNFFSAIHAQAVFRPVPARAPGQRRGPGGSTRSPMIDTAFQSRGHVQS
jgi:NAD(P)-dependent dehydrogenase (short-subunit alcohol dehydrogenase family)